MMACSFVQLDDLPDEVLLFILRKLDNVQVLYSLMGVNKRFNRVVCDSIFTSHLTLMKKSADGTILPLSERVLGRFYTQILPEIRQKIQCLNVKSSSIERILYANYRNLHGLGLYDFQMETITHLLTSTVSYFL